jgi:hypothetical protein
VAPPHPRQALQERRARGGKPDAGSFSLGQKVEQAENVSLREAPKHAGKHPLGTADGIKPVMNNGDAQSRRSNNSRAAVVVATQKIQPVQIFLVSLYPIL